MPRIFIIAGEPSGDLHGANLVKALKQQSADVAVQAWGGDKMRDAGAKVVKHVDELAFMGFVEVVSNLPQILRNFKTCQQQIEAFQPDLVVLIDYPGFNLRLAKKIQKLKVPIAYYIAPQAWAWKESRVKHIKAFVDHLFVILPFEAEFFQKHGIAAEYVGHPLLDEINAHHEQRAAQPEFKSSSKVIAVLPGSREQEVKKMAPLIRHLAKAFPTHQITVSRVPWLNKSLYSAFENENVKIFDGNTYDLLHAADAAVVTSGTATLETALFNTPQVVVYRANALSIAIARLLVKIKYISLVNLIMDRPVVKELIQAEATADNVVEALSKIVEGGERRTQMLDDYQKLRTKLGGGGASNLVASQLLKIVSRSKNED